MRVLYFTITPLMDQANGGSLCARNHIARLAADPGIELLCMVAGLPEWKPGTDAFFAANGIQYWFQPIFPGRVHHTRNDVRSVLAFASTAVFQFPWEIQALNQPHVQEGIDWAVRGYNIDVLIVEYHASALFITLPRRDVRTVLIAMNREAEFYAGQLATGRTHHGRMTGAISLRRARWFERRINAAVDRVVALNPRDMPRRGTRAPPVTIVPWLDPKPGPQRWTGAEGRQVFFVGHVAHYPNRQAARWIVRELAPALLRVAPDIRLVLVGAGPEDFPDAAANVELRGTAGADVAAELFQSAALLLCPVDNDFGVKFKSLEALSYGTPLLASRVTLFGLPYLVDSPVLDLEQPEDAAVQVAGLVGNAQALTSLSARQSEQQAGFAATQAGVWSRLLETLPPPETPHVRPV